MKPYLKALLCTLLIILIYVSFPLGKIMSACTILAIALGVAASLLAYLFDGVDLEDTEEKPDLPPQTGRLNLKYNIHPLTLYSMLPQDKEQVKDIQEVSVESPRKYLDRLNEKKEIKDKKSNDFKAKMSEQKSKMDILTLENDLSLAEAKLEDLRSSENLSIMTIVEQRGLVETLKVKIRYAYEEVALLF